MAGPLLSTQSKDHPASLINHESTSTHIFDPGTTIFDPDRQICNALLDHLSSSTSLHHSLLCQPFIKSGSIIIPELVQPIHFVSGLLDTGAQGSNFISRKLYNQLPPATTALSKSVDRVVRLGDSSSLPVILELPLTVSFQDTHGYSHAHNVWYSVLDVLSHDIIIGLIDLIGPYYDLFEDSITSSRHIATVHQLGGHLATATSQVQDTSEITHTPNIMRNAMFLDRQQQAYCSRKKLICSSSNTTIDLLALQDGSSAEILFHPRHGSVFSDNRIESRYQLLSSMLIRPIPGDVIPPWSRPIDEVAPEELDTPDPTSFPDDILVYLSTSIEEARLLYNADLDIHVTIGMREACPHIIDLLTSDLAYDVFVPTTWTGIKMAPYHLETKPGLPEYLKARTRPVRETLYKDAKAEFERMRSYFYEASTSPIASPLVVAPKATPPFIRLCGDYRPVNPYVTIPQEPIPHVQQAIAKAAGFKIFVDLDMTNSFHQIPIDLESSNLLSVSTPWGLFRPKFLPEGVGPASGILQSIVRRVFSDFDTWIIVIFDNFLILANDYLDAYSKLHLVLLRCQEHGLVLKMKKSWIGTDVVTFFGYEVRPGSWELSKTRKDAIAAMIFPATQKQMQSFLGAANFFHTHIPNYAHWASELYECTTTGFNWSPTSWSKDYKALFDLFKDAIQNSVTLHFPDYELPWIIRSDSSDHAVGAVLFQEYTDFTGNIIHQPISFASHKYSGAAVNWDTFKQEAYALFYAVTQFSYYLRGKEFTLETDHRNLLWIESSQVPIVVRWRVLLQSYVFKVKHIPGKDNTVADWLSRMYPVSSTLSHLSTVSPNPYPSLEVMFKSVHGNRSLHHGAKRTYLALCQRYPGHAIPIRVIQDLVAQCPLCQKDRIPLQPVPHATTVETLLQHTRSIGMDHVSISPTDEDGHIGLLLVVEHDTKFPYAYAVRDYTANTVAVVLFKHYCTFGTFDSIYSDPGSSLMSNVVNDLNTWLGIPHKVSLVGRHESNGTEHVNAILLGHLRRLVHDERLVTKWASDIVLPLINHALATTPNSELGGLTPAELKFGTLDFQHFRMPQELVPGHHYGDFVQQLDRNLSTVRSISCAYQLSLREKRQKDTTIRNTFQQNDLILWNPREHENSFRSSKLAPKLLGPYIVQDQLGNDITCRHLRMNTNHVFHSSRVTPYIGNINDAEDLALLDKDEYVIEAIISHRGNWNHLKSMQFMVKWSGYSTAENTWEPWSSLRRSIQLHDYLRLKNLSKYIPIAFK